MSTLFTIDDAREHGGMTSPIMADMPGYISELAVPERGLQFLEQAEKIFVSFKFDPSNCMQWIVLTGRKYVKNGRTKTCRTYLPAPQIPIVGGVWSDRVAMRMLAGQNTVSCLIESVYQYIKTSAEFGIPAANVRINPSADIVKVDRCLYAPFLYVMRDDGTKIYMDFLKLRYPQAYEKVQEFPCFTEYLENYHDLDVEIQ